MSTDRFLDISRQSLLVEAEEQERQGGVSEAEALYRKVIRMAPESAAKAGSAVAILTVNAYLKLGALLKEAGSFQEAIKCYQEGLAFKPTAELYNSLGIAFREVGRFAAAEAAYLDALLLEPNDPAILNNYANLLKEGHDKYDEAIECYEKALRNHPDKPAAIHVNLAGVLHMQNRMEESTAELNKALVADPHNNIAKFSLVMSQLAVIYENSEEIDERRRLYNKHLCRLADEYKAANEETRATAADSVGAVQPFFLAYQGRNDRPLQEIYGSMISQIMASRFPKWARPLSPPPIDGGSRIRVGFVSGQFYNHSVWKIPTKGWVTRLDRSQFELFGYHTGETRDQETAIAAETFTKFVQGPLPLDEWLRIITEDRLHAIVFPELGMHPVPLQIACLRLAPLQVTTYGHPVTSGLPTIDYYLSSDLMEGENGQDHYTEKLIRLPNLGLYYEPIDMNLKLIDPKKIGIEPNDIVYWSCQSLYKYLPEHDVVFARIAKELKDARFFFIASPTGQAHTDVFKNRLRIAFRDYGLNSEDHCRFLPRMTTQSFASVAAMADVFLDNIGWSGCNSALESIAHDVPVVTLGSEFMRGRHSLAVLKMMGLDEMIASSKDEYVSIAVRLGKDQQFCQHISERISETKEKLYCDLKPVRALENFFLTALRERECVLTG